MIEAIGQGVLNFWEGLPFLIKWPLWFWFNIIIVRGIVARRISTWLDDKGWFDHYLVEPVIERYKAYQAILQEEVAKVRQTQA